MVIEQYTEVMAAKNATARTHDGTDTGILRKCFDVTGSVVDNLYSHFILLQFYVN